MPGNPAGKCPSHANISAAPGAFSASGPYERLRLLASRSFRSFFGSPIRRHLVREPPRLLERPPPHPAPAGGAAPRATSATPAAPPAPARAGCPSSQASSLPETLPLPLLLLELRSRVLPATETNTARASLLPRAASRPGLPSSSSAARISPSRSRVANISLSPRRPPRAASLRRAPRIPTRSPRIGSSALSSTTSARAPPIRRASAASSGQSFASAPNAAGDASPAPRRRASFRRARTRSRGEPAPSPASFAASRAILQRHLRLPRPPRCPSPRAAAPPPAARARARPRRRAPGKRERPAPGARSTSPARGASRIPQRLRRLLDGLVFSVTLRPPLGRA